MLRTSINSLIFFLLFTASSGQADPQFVRYTGIDDKDASLAHVLDVVRAKTGIVLPLTDFQVVEERPLANNYFTMYAQMAGGLPRTSLSVRTWTAGKGGDAIQVEALVDALLPTNIVLRAADTKLSSARTMSLVSRVVKSHEDKFMGVTNWKDGWEGKELVRTVTVKGRRGKHVITLSLDRQNVVKAAYQEFPQADTHGEFSIPTSVYPIYEEFEETGAILPRISSELRYLNELVRRPASDPYAPLKTQRYFESMFNPLLGMTEEGRKQGYWAMGYIKQQAAKLQEAIELSQNSFEGRGLILDGRYATINLHPGVPKAFPNISFVPGMSSQFRPDWQPTPENPEVWEMLPTNTILGLPLKSLSEGLSRQARRLADHDPTTYINDGFDELQVYWAVNQMFDSLRPMGFTDPELSTRRFNAFLYDPDISYRDNAYYTDDTINFTTYSSKSSNMARDNTTIWHELGHGVMDRLMGDEIRLADTGGLSEGMADFVAQMVLLDVTNNEEFLGKKTMRIFNRTGFGLTNEVHDDGEAYGGAMNDLLVEAIAQFGRPGLTKVTDLTLETMRLTRNHPGLTANDWFEHMLFADRLGNGAVRSPNELGRIVTAALAGRNFSLDGAPVADYSFKNGDQEVLAGTPGSRQRPIAVPLKETETASYKLNLKLKSTSSYAFKYPVTVKVQLRGGPIQGAIHWVGEETQPVLYTLNSENDTLPIDLTVTGKCDEVNRPDGSCVDFAYVQIWNQGETEKPQAKKRFYLRIVPQPQT